MQGRPCQIPAVYPVSYTHLEVYKRQLLDFFRALRQEGFFRKEEPMALSMEVSPRPEEDADIVLANTKRVIKRAWALLEDEPE